MRKSFLNTISLVLITLLFSAVYSVQAQVRAYRVTDRQVQNLINRIETRTDTFKDRLSNALDRSALNGTRSEDQINAYVGDFEKATDNLRDRFNSRNSAASDVQEVLNRAAYIDAFMRQNPLNTVAQRQWILVRNDLNLLANYYSVRWNWSGVMPTVNNNAAVNSGAYIVANANLTALLRRIEERTDVYKRTMETALDRSSLDNSRAEDNFMRYLTEFENATDRLRHNYEEKKAVSGDAQEVLNRAQLIDQFMRDNRFAYNAESQWNLLRSDLNMLATSYRVTAWDWNRMNNNPYWNSNANAGMNDQFIVADARLTTLLKRIEQRTDIYKRAMDRAFDRSSVDGTQTENNYMSYIKEFENATDRLRQNYEARKGVSGDAQEVLYRAQLIDRIMQNNRFANNAETQWNLLRNDLSSLADLYRVSWNWNTMNSNPYWSTNVNNNTTVGNTYRVPDSSVQNVLRRIETNTDAYKSDLSSVLDRSVLNGTKSEDQINAYVADFEKATDNLRSRFDSRRSVSTDVEEVLNRAYFIDTFMRDYRLSANVESRWNIIRSDLNTLANYYNVSWNWVRPNIPPTRLDAQLTGTYRLNTMQSDNVANIVNSAVNSYYINDRQRDQLRQNLERRLMSPEILVIEKMNNQVTVASSNSQQITFNADGTVQTEQTANGRTVKISADTTYDGVSLNYEGDRINDFYVNFMPMNNGQLRVIRRIFLENRNDMVTVASVYDKIEPTANFSRVYNSNTAQNYPNSNTVNNDFVVPNGTQLVADLNAPISTKTANEGDRFTMTVTSPNEYQGAIIEGHLSDTQQSGRVTGRAQVTFNFDTIRLRNGQTYRFAGLIDRVVQPNGETISINNEGAVRDNNQTTKTITRAGIGAALGAIIGAIAGGGQGAAIGAAIGAGAGAGTVVLQGRDNLDLETGADFVITSSAPNNLR